MPHDLPKGDIPTLILAVLCDAPRHGYSIAREVERLSENVLLLREGSLYPALRVLEQDGLVTSQWVVPPSGTQSRRVYTVTEAGRGELAKRANHWRSYARFMQVILGNSENSGEGSTNEQPT